MDSVRDVDSGNPSGSSCRCVLCELLAGEASYEAFIKEARSIYLIRCWEKHKRNTTESALKSGLDRSNYVRAMRKFCGEAVGDAISARRSRKKES